MYRVGLLLFAGLLLGAPSFGQNDLDALLPVRGVSIAAPEPEHVDEFVDFIRAEFIPRHVNVLVLRVDYGYAYESHPELRDENPLSREDVKKIVDVCREGGIRIIPQINLLGHQSWHSELGKLLEMYPQFDETPSVELPENYEWPNEDGLYCKSYCPRHPEVHDVVFAVMDEIVEVFETDAFHAGMDEVFYIGEEECPRCGGRDKAELFADEVTAIRNHLAAKNRELWIWGDRLIDGKETGIGMWEASMNRTYRALEMIPKDVVINDWHYNRAVPTPPLFAAEGLRVVSCPWNRAAVGVAQVDQMLLYREHSTPEMKDRFAGVMQTIWSGAKPFMDQFYGRAEDERGDQAACFRAVFERIEEVR